MERANTEEAGLMGCKYELKCEGCGYSAVVSGGKDVGMVAVVQTMTCHDCKDLVDVLIGRYGEEGPIDDAVSAHELGSCPECGGKKVVPWDETRPCPSCGTQMVPGELAVMWD